jgi:hypothetical protein
MPMKTAILRALAFPGAIFFTLDCGGTSNGDACAPYDADGIVSGTYTFVVTIDDAGFSPAILKAQNRAKVVLAVTNAGTKPHDLVIGCLPTPNDQGCPSASCFPAEARVPLLEPGSSGSTVFVVPNPEGIYPIRSDVAGDSHAAQFVIQ